jgi:hypothetical protein
MMYPQCGFCGRKSDESPALLVATLHGSYICSPCVVKDAEEALDYDAKLAEGKP